MPIRLGSSSLLTCYQLFFDLFFAANLTVFSEAQQVTNASKFTSYIGYFWYVVVQSRSASLANVRRSMLWFTWLLVGLYDVRFVTDSIFGKD
jgi:hypothetical protein